MLLEGEIVEIASSFFSCEKNKIKFIRNSIGPDFRCIETIHSYHDDYIGSVNNEIKLINVSSVKSEELSQERPFFLTEGKEIDYKKNGKH